MNDNLEKIKVLQITVRADFGGGPEHLYQLIDFNEKIEIFIASPEDEPYYDLYRKKVGESKIISIPHRKFNITTLVRLIKFIKQNKIEIIHSHGKGAGIYSRLVSFFTRAKCVHTFHGVHILNYGLTARFVYMIIERFLSFFTDKFIVVSESEKKKVLNNNFAPSEKLTLIPNGIYIPTELPDLKQKFSSNKLLHISRFDYAKNSILMFDIVEAVNKVFGEDEFEFVFVGDGSEKKQLVEKFRLEGIENVSFEGFQKEINPFYKAAFCLISTSKWEGLPLTVLEAMAYGTPVVASDVDGNNDLVQNNETGFLFELSNPVRVSQVLSELKSNYALFERISQSGRETITKNFDRRNMIKQTEDIYLSLV